MSPQTVRVKLRFDFTPINYARKCWFVFDSEKCRLVKDVAHLITSHFGLRSAMGIQLYLEDYLLPTNEKVQVIRDNDLINVRMVNTSSSSESSSSEGINSPIPASKQIKTTQAPPPPAKELVAVTKKSASGGLHTKFHTSSSSSSSDSSSSSEDDSDSSPTTSTKPPPRPATQWDVKKLMFHQTKTTGVAKLGRKNWASSSVSKRIAANINRRGRGLNRRNVITGAVVGGPRDILTTRSRVYAGRSVVQGKVGGSAGNTRRRGKRAEQLSLEMGGEGNGEKEEGEVEGGEGEGEEEGEENSDGNNDMETAPAAVVEAKDYTSYPDLQGPPRVGDKLAFKVLELSSSYTPEVSQYREGTVVNVDSDQNTVRLKYSDDTLALISEKASNGNSPGKFSVNLDGSGHSESEPDAVPEVKEEVNIPVSELLQPKLIT